METLGLSSATPQRNDNIFQRLFWPSIQNQDDVDLIGQRGFWICAVIGILSGLVLLVAGQPVIGLFMLVIFLAGACGVRERSISAASLMLTLYVLNVGSGVLLPPHRLPSPLITLVVLALLMANVRAALLSSRWLSLPSSESEAVLPERLAVTFTDKLANRFPHVLWPKVKYAFFIASGIYIALAIAGAWMLITHKTPAGHRAGTTPSQQIQVEPPQ